MTAPAGPGGPASTPPPPRRGPSLVPGVVLLVVGVVLMVIVLIKPDMPGWLTTTVAVLAIAVVLALLGYAFVVFVSMSRRSGP